MMGGLAFLFGSLDALSNPLPEVLDGVAADAKLDQMKRHVAIRYPRDQGLVKRMSNPALMSVVDLTFASMPPREDQSVEAAAGADGAKDVAGAGVRAGFGAGCFLAAATVGGADAVGRGDGEGALADGAC